jgi:hypothetical protein
MKLIVAFTLATISLFVSAQEVEHYAKKDATVALLRMNDGALPFMLNSVVGQYACNIKGRAEFITPTRAAYAETDGGKCVAVFNFKGRNLVITTKDCDGYCGLGAAGSLDGTYRFTN